MTPIYREYDNTAHGWAGWWEVNGKAIAWVATDGEIVYAVDLL